MPKATLEQWRMLKAVVDAGGFAKAAELVHKSPSSINHAVQKLQMQLGVALLEVRGRKAELTLAGEAMLRRAEHLLQEAARMEGIASAMAQGVESEIALAVDQLVPQDAVIDALERFSRRFPNTRIELHETVLDGASELLRQGRADFFLGPSVPSGFLAEPVGQIRMVCVAHAQHPLAHAGSRLSLHDLRAHRQVVVRDSSESRSGEGGWLDAERRWTVDHISTALRIVRAGLAFAWLPECAARDGMEKGSLVELDLEAGGTQLVTLSLAFADRDRAGEATRALAGIFCGLFREPVRDREDLPDWWSLARCGSGHRL